MAILKKNFIFIYLFFLHGHFYVQVRLADGVQLCAQEDEKMGLVKS